MSPTPKLKHTRLISSEAYGSELAALDGEVNIVADNLARMLRAVDTKDLECDLVALVHDNLIGLPAVGRYLPPALGIGSFESVALTLR